MVRTNLQKAKDLLDKFDACIKNITVLYDVQIGNWGVMHIKGAFEQDVIPFFKNLRESFEVLKWDFTKRENDCDESWKIHDVSLITETNNKSFKINDLKVQLQEKSIIVNELKQLLATLKRKSHVTSGELPDLDSSYGIVSQLTLPYTPQNNVVSERKNRTFLEMARSMMNSTTLPKSFWGYALESAARILNMVPTKKVDKTPYEIWNGKAPNLSYLKVWGCEALVKQDTLDKLEAGSVKCIFVGYPKETMGYYFYNPPENNIFVARYADEQHDEVEPNEVEPHSVKVPIHRSERISQAHDRYGFYVDVEEHELGTLNEHPSYKDALSDLKFDQWLDAMNA
ncbi:retrotransposon protein, putative, ty1-copia subclass [Tanacetum coccineum]